MENKPDRCAGTMEGTLPGKCASLVFPYVPMQDPGAEKYDQKEGLAAGTLFPGLNMPFFRAIKTRMNCDNTALCELMALSFAATELGLYLDTHREDTEALELYRKYVSMLKEGKTRYEEKCGPLQQADVTGERGWNWLNDPWPWDTEGGCR